MRPVTRRRLHGAYYAWWLGQIIPIRTPIVLEFVIAIYVYSKFTQVSLPRRTLANVNFQASLEGRMYSSLVRHFAVYPVETARGRSLSEVVKFCRYPSNEQRWQKTLEAIDELSITYEDTYHAACPYPVRYLPRALLREMQTYGD